VNGSDIVVSMIGSGSAPAMLAARALLAGNGVAHRWIDTDTDPVGRLLARTPAGKRRCTSRRTPAR
jgi:hypothetical protein